MVDQADMSDEETIEILTELFDDVQQLQKEEIAKQQKQDEETIEILTELFDDMQELQKEEIAKQHKQDEETIEILTELFDDMQQLQKEEIAEQQKKDNETIKALGELLPKVGAIRAKYAKLEEIQGTHFNIFSVLHKEKDEVNLHSKFIWCYLTHAQSTSRAHSFFGIFCKQQD